MIETQRPSQFVDVKTKTGDAQLLQYPPTVENRELAHRV